MTAAQCGAFQEDHASTARMWDAEIAARGFAMGPFGWRVTSLLEKAYKPEVVALRAASTGDLQTKPTTADHARGAAAGYLSGSASWYAWQGEERVRETPA